MPEALEEVRRELGLDAVILQARYLRSRGLLGERKCGVEVTAGVPAGTGGGAADDGRRELLKELAELRKLVWRLLDRGAGAERAYPPVLAELREKLLAQALPDPLVRALIERAGGDILDDPASAELPPFRRNAARGEVLSLLERMLPTSGPVRLKGSRAARIALVGPTGVGKTTTIAKLAAQLRLREGRSVGMIAADTYRVAAVEQLRRYAEILGAPLRVARSPEDISRAAWALSGQDTVFIDTLGGSPRNKGRIEELAAFMEAARPDETHLVLSAASDPAAIFTAVDRFAPLGVDRLVFSKLDEAERTGSILQGSARAKAPVSYLTTGQEVPEDIELADSKTLARLVLDGPSVRSRAEAPRRLRRSA
jgi:flagellar biosynthesis protein FlhF